VDFVLEREGSVEFVSIILDLKSAAQERGIVHCRSDARQCRNTAVAQEVVCHAALVVSYTRKAIQHQVNNALTKIVLL
jgi:hypothetical protein